MTSATRSPIKESDGDPGWIDALLVWAGIALTLLVLATTIQIIRITYFPLPLFDAWDDWQLYLGYGKKYTAFLFFQHNEHRIVVARLFFWIDHFVFHARSTFLIVSIVVVQALDFILLWRLSGRAQKFTRPSYLLLGCFLASCLFSAQQFTNFTWGFQIQFVAVYCAMTGAIFALLRTAEAQSKGTTGTRWIAITLIAAVLSTYSMANGLFVWPVLILFAIWLRLPTRYLIALGAGAVAISTFYLWGYHRPGLHSDPIESLTRLPQLIEFSAAYLGSPVDPVLTTLGAGADSVRLVCAAVFGCIGALAALCGIAAVWRKRDRFRPAQAALAHILLFIIITAASVASGRLNFPTTDALTYRYHTPALIFWGCLVSLAWSMFEPKLKSPLRRRLVYAGVVFWILLGMALERPAEIAHARGYADLIGESQAALAAGVFDSVPWTRAYHKPIGIFNPRPWVPEYHTPVPTDMISAVDYLRSNHLSVFTEEWTRWPGTRISDHFVIDRGNSCLGHFDDATLLPSTVMPGSRVAGWAWDLKTNRAPEVVVLADDSLQIVGVARNHFDRDDVQRAVPAVHSTRVGWRGYMAGSEARNVTAYLLESDERSVCPLTSLPTGNTAQAVQLSQMPHQPVQTLPVISDFSSSKPVALAAATLSGARSDCSLDLINGVPIRSVNTSASTMLHQGNLDVVGWSAVANDGIAPDEVYVSLSSATTSLFARAQTLMARGDVAQTLGKPSLLNSGFQLQGGPVPPGTYSLAILQVTHKQAWRCGAVWQVVVH